MSDDPTTEDVQIGITLARIAYLGKDSDPVGEFKAMAKALQQKDLPTQNQWGLVWGPANLESNLMYIVQGPPTQFGRRYAVVIRGTILTVKSVLEDIEMLDLVDLPWNSGSAPTGTRISTGICEGFKRLIEMKDGGGRTAMDFLNGLKRNDQILVCGHSLGGCLTTVMALYLKDMLAGQAIRPAPFAGQTAGNQEFANWYASRFSGTTRWANRLDIIPTLWNHTTLKAIKQLYPGGPPCDSLFKGLVDLSLLAADHHFFQPEPGTSLDGQLYDESGILEFEKEAEAQHNSIYYMYLTGIALSVIQGTPFHPGLGSGWWPPGQGPGAKG